MNLLKKFKHKTQGLSNHEIAQEIKRVLKARFIHRFRRVRYKLLGTEISDRKLKASLAPDYKNDDQLLVYFKQRQTPSIFWGVERAEETAKTISEFSVTFIDETLQIADEVCNHTFYFLGHTHIYQKLDWFYDCTNGYSWPKSHYSEIVLSNAKPGSDVKIPWELARLQHAVCLGQAYCLTANEKYSQEFCLQVRSFYEENPPEVGIHWLSPMEVALRAVNLSVGFYFFRASKSFDLATLKSMLKIVFSHAKFIEENLERSVRITSNHYLSDLVGLLFIGILFPEFKRAKKWREFALSEILKEMDKQVYSDGVDWEASIGYHALVLELFLYSFLLCKVNKIDIERRYWDKLAKMFLFVKAYIKPDNTAPLIGDWDDGRVFIWKNRHTTDHSYLLSIAAIIYEDERFKVTGFPAEESIWIFGQQGYETFENIGTEQQAERSAAFPEAGIYIQRDNGLYAIIDCGEVGIKGQGSHGHNDMLSFELCYLGKTFIVDPGSYCYTGDKAARNLFRSTAYHNTVMIDGVEINEIYPDSLFAIGNQAKPKINAWITNEECDLLDAEHNGYQRLKEPVIHRRVVKFNKVVGNWLVEDIFSGEGEHDFAFFFNFDAGISVELGEKMSVLLSDDEEKIQIAIVPVDTEGLSVELVERYVSKGYNHRVKSWGAVYRLKKRVPFSKSFLITPAHEGAITDIEDREE